MTVFLLMTVKSAPNNVRCASMCFIKWLNRRFDPLFIDPVASIQVSIRFMDSVSSAVGHAQRAALSSVDSGVCGNIARHIYICGRDHKNVVGNLHDIAVNRIAGAGSEINDPLSYLNIEPLQVENDGAVG